MTNIAILGLGVVGAGVAELLTGNASECTALLGDKINIKYILDLKDFPDSPFSDKVVHSIDVILSDCDVDIVVETMGGLHPAYEFTKKCLLAGKSVVSSNKEVVAAYGDELLKVASDNGVCYRFEASVGGGIPVVSTLISSIRQNRFSEIRGILNGTTNYILTKMFDFGDSFENALKKAQEKGFAEKKPDADVLGFDAARKIIILTAIATGKLFPVESVHTEGITGIRGSDVTAAEKIGRSVKLVGRCIEINGSLQLMVAPFMIGDDSLLKNVNGVYNAVEYVGDPIGSTIFYGRGAGAGATASAVVSDIIEISVTGRNYACPIFVRSEAPAPFGEFVSKHYLAFDKTCESDLGVLGGIRELIDNEIVLITDEISETELEKKLEQLSLVGITPLSHIRLL